MATRLDEKEIGVHSQQGKGFLTFIKRSVVRAKSCSLTLHGVMLKQLSLE
jgi:hypothetical protein